MTQEYAEAPQFCHQCQKTKTHWDFHSEASGTCRGCQLFDRRKESKANDPAKHKAWGANITARIRLESFNLPAEQVPHKELKQIFEDSQGICAYCGLKDRELQLEHCIPISRGGRHTPVNLVMACQECNYRKHSKTPKEYADSLLLNTLSDPMF